MKHIILVRNFMHLISISLMLFGLVVLHTIINREIIYIFTENYPYIIGNDNINFFGMELSSIFFIDLFILVIFSGFLIELFLNLAREPRKE